MSSQANTAPRALVHKQILSAAAEMPEASLEEIADEVTGASTPLVERVLEEYGDPADDAESNPMSEPDLPIDIDELSSAQRETLAAVLEQPDATQQEVATKLDVSSATVSQRLRDIEGFDWADRGSIVATLAERDVSLPNVASAVEDGSAEPEEADVSDGSTDTDDSADVDHAPVDDPAEPMEESEKTEEMEETMEPTDEKEVPTETEEPTEEMEEPKETDSEPAEPSESVAASEVEADAPVTQADIAEIELRLTVLEDMVAAHQSEVESVLERGLSELEADIEETIADGGQFDTQPALEDDELLAKVIRASMADETISDDEELRIIEALR